MLECAPILTTLCVLLVSSLGLGTPIAQRLRLHPAESLCVAVGISWLIVFNVSFGAYLAGSLQYACVPLLLGSASGLVLGRRQLLVWSRCGFTRSMVLAFLALTAFCLVHQAGTPVYLLGAWYGDWFEHYQRMMFFLLHVPLETRFLNGIYALPARPPMQNVCQAYVAGLTNQTFFLFQVSSTCLAALLCLPVFLLLRRVARGGGVSVWLAAAVLGLNWPFVVNATFTWTKAFSAFYVLLALALYSRKGRKREILAFGAMAAGVLVHYSSALALLPLILWHLGSRMRKPREIPESVMVGLPGAALLLPWVLFVTIRFPGGLVQSTSSAGMVKSLSTGQWLYHAGIDALITLFPFYSRTTVASFARNNPWGGLNYLCEYSFNLSLHTWPGSIGLAGALMTAVEAAWIRRWRPSMDLAFWTWLLLGTLILLGLAYPTNTNDPALGICQLAMLPFVVATAAWIAGGWPRMSIRLRGAMTTAVCVQATMGLMLGAYIATAAPQLPDGRIVEGFHGPRAEQLNQVAVGNLLMKQRHHLVFLADLIAPWMISVFFIFAAGAIAWALVLIWHVNRRSPRRARRTASKEVGS